MIFNGNTWNVNSGAMITTAMGITNSGFTIGGSSNLNITLPNTFTVNELTINNPNATVNQPAAITLNELSSRGVYNQNNTLTVNNNFTIQNGGTFNAGAQVLNFQNASITNNGSFNRGTGTVNFTTNNGTNRSVTGVWNFFNVNFINTAMAQTVSFMPGIAGAITVDGTFSVQGASGALLTLNSSTIGNQFLLNTQNKGAFNYIRVQDSNVAGSNPSILPLTTVSASRIINLGNNNGWFTAPTGQVLRIGSAVASDPSGSDNIYNVGDKITVTFSIPTNQKPANLIKTNLDQLFNFSSNIGSDYTGSWASPTSLVINIKNATGATPPVMGRFNISIRPGAISPGMGFGPASGTAVLSTLQTFVTGSFSLTPTLVVEKEFTIQQIKMGPVPFRASAHNFIRFMQLSKNTKVDILDITGYMIYRFSTGNQEIFNWDVRTSSGLRVGSGVYMAVFTKDDQQRVIKFIVVR